MNLKEIVAVSSLSGLYKMVSSRNNGIIIADLDTGKTRFAATRKYQFTPLESIAIFTESDSVELSSVFNSMLEKASSLPPVAVNSDKVDIISYFKEILPDYDRDRVHVGDMKKVIKWFNFLNDRNMLSKISSDEEE
jgi:hypothetical protein